MTTKNIFLSVAIPTPQRRLFENLPVEITDHIVLKPGLRVSVSFGKRKNITGIIVAVNNKTTHPQHKLKKINYIIDDKPIVNIEHLNFLNWASNYYHYPIGEVIYNALPILLRKNNSITDYEYYCRSLSNKQSSSNINSKNISLVQIKILNYFQKNKTPVNEFELYKIFPRAKRSLLALEKIGLIKKETEKKLENSTKINKRSIKLNENQNTAINKILDSINTNSVFLLDGITGSGKTEVYMSVMESVIKSKKQCLGLLPEIGLTPQLIQRFKNRFKVGKVTINKYNISISAGFYTSDY